MVAAGHRPLAQGVPAGTPLGYIQSRERDLVGLAGDLACPPVTRYYQKKKVYVRVDVPLCLIQGAVGRGVSCCRAAAVCSLVSDLHGDRSDFKHHIVVDSRVQRAPIAGSGKDRVRIQD